MTSPQDSFEVLLHDALQSSEQPSADFSARVMAQVAQTPQVKPVSPKRVWKTVAAIAACLAVTVIAVPAVLFGTMRAGSAAPAQAAEDCCTESECITDAAEEIPQDDFIAQNFASDAPTDRKDAANETQASGSVGNDFGLCQAPAPEEAGAPNAPNAKETETVSISDAALQQQVREWLTAQGISIDSDGTCCLTAQQTEALQTAIPALELPAGACMLAMED